MQAIRWSRSILLFTTIVISTSQAGLGCSGDDSLTVKDGEQTNSDGSNPPPIGGIPQCEAYKDDADVYGYCLYKFAGGFPSISEVDRLCPMAGKWEKECRHAWVSGRMQPNSGFDMDTLLAVCDGNPDCTFELIDFRPDSDVVTQIQYCIDYVGPYTRDCIGHAMQRWWYTAPSAEEVSRVASLSTPYPDRLAFYIAASVGCSNIGTCEGDARVQKICEKNVENYQKFPNRCPAQEEKPMHGSMKPEDFQSKTGMSKPQQPVQKHGPPLKGGNPPKFTPQNHQPKQQ